jgi:hypothetical protein
MLSSSSSDSSDEEIRPPIRRPPRPIMRGDPFTEYTEFQFKLRFRFSKIGAREILTLIEENLAHLSDRNDPITPALQLLITLRFYATGTFHFSLLTIEQSNDITLLIKPQEMWLKGVLEY